MLPFAWRDPYPEPLGGHYGVTRSLVAGLRSLGSRFVYSPPLSRVTARTAIVLAGIAELKAAIDWRQRHGCELLLAGPNVVEMPNDHDGILLSPGIDRIIVASDKVRRQYEASAPQLAGRIWVWPAGVDESYWKPSGRRARDMVLIYNKRMPELAKRISATLSDRGVRCETVNYGDHRKDKYRLHEFRAALDRTRLCIFLTLDEPQGLAAAEAWSMDVPVLAFRAPGYEKVDTVPYLSPATGSYWSSMDDLPGLVAGFSPADFQPRNWVLANMTDRVCAKDFIRLTARSGQGLRSGQPAPAGRDASL
jgi:glycosyltransferase involved in cell wall biosynthesis